MILEQRQGIGGNSFIMPRKYGLRALLVVVLASVAALAVLGLCACSMQGPVASENEILLDIQLDTAEDIGLLLINWAGGGSDGAGGISNADKTLLRHDERVFWTLERVNFEHPEDLHSLELDFHVVTEYVEPNMEDIYPEEITYGTNPLVVGAAFGNVYRFRISGSPGDGFEAVDESAD